MASWLEQLGGDLSNATSAIIGAGASKLAAEIGPDQEAPLADKPERQFDTTIEQPANGPQSKAPPNPAAAFADIWGQYKWLIAGGLVLGAVMAFKGAR